MTDRTCSVSDCDTKVLARGLCTKHYGRMRKYGTTDLPPRPPKPPKPEPAPKRIDELRALVAIQTHDCVEWPHARFPTGYGHVHGGSGQRYTHREAMVIAGITPGTGQTVVRHLCDNPPCVNVRHLRWGTVQDNIDDRQRSGVWHKAMGKRMVALSELERQQIVRYSKVKMPQTAIAHRFGVSTTTVREIVKGTR